MSAEEDRGGEGADRPGAYVLRASEGMLSYARELTLENHNLRVHVAALQSEHVGLVAGLQRARRENDRHAARYRELELRSTSVTNLYVASYGLHGTLDRQAVLRTIQEIVMNLVGCEEMAIFEVDEAGRALELVGAAGIDPERYREMPFGIGLIGGCARTGELFVAGDPETGARGDGEETVSACIPLRLDGRVLGVIALFRLLSHKPGIEDLDRALFDLLATHAATALYCSSLHARLSLLAPGA